jgi:hypothetical protein
MVFIITTLWFVAFSALTIIAIWRLEVNSRTIRENSRILERFAPESSKEDRKAIVPPSPSENVSATSPHELRDAEIQAIPRRPQCDTLISGSEPPPSRDTTPHTPAAELLDNDEDCPTTVLPRCGECGSVDYVPSGGLFQCKVCGNVGHLRFPGQHQKVA